MANNAISLKDICDQTNNIEEDLYISMTDFGPVEYTEILKHTKPITLGDGKNKVDVTIMDLFNLPLQKDEEIINYIKKHIDIDITSKEGIKKINELFKYAIDIYENRYLRILPFKMKKKSFNTTNSIIEFIRETKTNKTSGILNCAILKVCYAAEDIISNEKIRRADFLDSHFMKEYMEKPFQIEEGFSDKYGNLYRIGKVVINGKIINFKLISRQKSQESIIGKQIADPTYYSISEFKDLVGMTIYVNTTEDAILMMQYIDQMIYKGEGIIKNKNAITRSCISKSEKLNFVFRRKLLDSMKSHDTIESVWELNIRNSKGTSQKYTDVKLKGIVQLPLEEGEKSTKYPVGTEIKFIIGGHDNESGVCLQSIYDYIKRFRELTRLGLPIRKLDIVKYVNDFFENINETLKKKNKKKTDYYEELYNDLVELDYIKPKEKLTSNNEKILAKGLYTYFRNKLVKVKMGTNSKQTYYFDERALKLRNVGMHKPQLQKI